MRMIKTPVLGANMRMSKHPLFLIPLKPLVSPIPRYVILAPFLHTSEVSNRLYTLISTVLCTVGVLTRALYRILSDTII